MRLITYVIVFLNTTSNCRKKSGHREEPTDPDPKIYFLLSVDIIVQKKAKTNTLVQKTIQKYTYESRADSSG